jgi:ketosteroid isomerase-like protein
LNSLPNPDTDSDVSKIAAVLEALNAALNANDANRLATLVTDDVCVGSWERSMPARVAC